jgi:Protein of unknown function (DUF3014)
MPDYPDYELHRPPGGPIEPPPSNTGKWMVVAVLALVGAGAVWFALSRSPAPQPEAGDATAAAAPEPEMPPLGTTPAPIEVPPLDMSDAFVRELVRQLSSHPTIAAWLATDGLIRNFTVVVSNVADGRTPARQLQAVKPSERFVASERGGQLTIDPGSYRRYDRHVAALASIDPQQAARLYATLKPRIEEAYRDLGFPNTPFDRTLARAFVMLLNTPVVDRPVALEPSGASGYAFADPELETLPGAQRQMLRMGPDNVRKANASLRALALALGIPSAQLPPLR